MQEWVYKYVVELSFSKSNFCVLKVQLSSSKSSTFSVQKLNFWKAPSNALKNIRLGMGL